MSADSFNSQEELWDAIIVGGGPAGLSAALFLGRCRRRTLLFDDGRYRNAAARASHGFFTRDGEAPLELVRLGREQLAPYAVQVVEQQVVHAQRHPQGFEVRTAAGRHLARKLLIATGLIDELPRLEGLQALYGRSVFHCPMCDGWEVRDARIAVLGPLPAAVELGLALTTWTDDVALCSQGEGQLSRDQALELQAHGIEVYSERVARLVGEDGRLQAIEFVDGSSLQRDALFLADDVKQRSPLAQQFDCEINGGGRVRTAADGAAGTSGLYVVGDASEDVSFIAIAVAEGTRAACAANKALRKEDSAARVAAFLRERAHKHAS